MPLMKNFKFHFQNVFALLIFGSIFYYFFINPDATVNETYKNILLIVVGFMFGSSKSSHSKDETIKNMADTSSVETINTDDISGDVKSENVNLKN